jgi:hypothetical protein
VVFSFDPNAGRGLSSFLVKYLVNVEAVVIDLVWLRVTGKY